MKTFTEKVLDIVKNIKEGEVMTYSGVAVLAGNSQASRAVGTIMAHNQDKTIPCHRVIKSDGSIGMYNGLRGKSKQELLKKEGIKFKKSGVVFMS